LLEAGGGHVRIWDLSPELPGALDLVRNLSVQGIVCSIAHTQASIDQARAAVDAGARLVTHLYDTFELPEVADPGVYPVSLIDYLLIEDRVACEIVPDGTHAHPILVEKAFRCKPPAGVVCITDSNYGAGLAPGRYTLPGSWGLVEVRGPTNGVRQVERGMQLAGSALTPIDGLRNLVHNLGCSLARASRAWSAAPARVMGLNRGRIAPGADADLIVLDRDLALLHTMVRGRLAYSA
jgi:N-acetylglucosamine-6-phosphate deacetylase